MIIIHKISPKITPTHKVGIKLLTDEQMKNIFPNYQVLLEKIEYHRSAIAGMDALPDYQYNMMYDNMFAIFGKRGTGKTSAIFSLQQKLKDNASNSYDVVLPIIIPEVIPADCSILGWILATVREQIVELEKKIKKIDNDVIECGNHIWSGCEYEYIKAAENNLSQKIDALVELYFSGKYNPGIEASYNLAVGNSAKQAGNYYQFTKSIVALWDEWVKAIRWLAQKECDCEDKIVTPLIYFIFDDVDLAPEKANELVSVIMKYLSHPNIVVLMTADEGMLLEVLENNLDARIGKLPKEWREYLNRNKDSEGVPDSFHQKKESNNLIHDTAQRYLGKILPTSTRYYLKLFESSEDKRWFCLESGTYLAPQLISLMDELMELSIKETHNYICPKPDENITFYLNFLGTTSRQIGNAWLGIESFIKELRDLTQTGKADLKYIYDSCVHFIRIIINSNHNLSGELGDLDEFTNNALQLEHYGWELYINYPFLEEFFKQTAEHKKAEQVVRLIIQVYSLFMFMENILLILENCFLDGVTGRRHLHGIIGMSRLLNEYAFDGKKMIREDLEADKYFVHYKVLLNRLANIYEKGENEKKEDIDYFFDFVSCKKTASKKYRIIKEGFNNNRGWFRQIIEKMSLVYSGLYLLEKRDIEVCFVYTNQPILYEYQDMIKNMLQQNIRKILDRYSLLEETDLEETISGRKLSRKKAQETLEKEIGDWVTNRIDSELENRYHRYGLIDSQEPMYVKLSSVIDRTEELYGENELIELLQYLPERLNEDIKTKLLGESSEESIQDMLRLLERYITEADDMFHTTCVCDIQRFLTALTELEHITLMPAGIRYLTAGVRDYVKKYADKLDKFSWIQWPPETKADLNLLVKKVYNLAADESDKKMQTELLKSLASFQRTNEKMVLLNGDRKEVEDAFALGLSVCVMKKIQAYYLYKVVQRKNEYGHSYSPERLQYLNYNHAMNSGVDNNQGRSTGKIPAYYYDMFLQIKKFLEEKLESGNDAVMQRYIDNVVSMSRKRYIGNLLREVDDESISY